MELQVMLGQAQKLVEVRLGKSLLSLTDEVTNVKWNNVIVKEGH